MIKTEEEKDMLDEMVDKAFSRPVTMVLAILALLGVSLALRRADVISVEDAMMVLGGLFALTGLAGFSQSRQVIALGGRLRSTMGAVALLASIGTMAVGVAIASGVASPRTATSGA